MRKMIKILNIALLLLISCCVSAGAAENSSDAKTTGLKLVSLKDQIPDSNNMQVESVDLENNWVIASEYDVVSDNGGYSADQYAYNLMKENIVQGQEYQELFLKDPGLLDIYWKSSSGEKVGNDWRSFWLEFGCSDTESLTDEQKAQVQDTYSYVADKYDALGESAGQDVLAADYAIQADTGYRSPEGLTALQMAWQKYSLSSDMEDTFNEKELAKFKAFEAQGDDAVATDQNGNELIRYPGMAQYASSGNPIRVGFSDNGYVWTDLIDIDGDAVGFDWQGNEIVRYPGMGSSCWSESTDCTGPGLKLGMKEGVGKFIVTGALANIKDIYELPQ